MSDSTELRRIVGAMTERPDVTCSCSYPVERCPVCHARFDPIAADVLMADALIGPVCRDDRLLMIGQLRSAALALRQLAPLANHADALVKLVEACERYVRGIDPEVFSTRAEADLHHALADALAAVNAVKESK